MPIYEYVCMKCESHFEELVSVGAPDPACPDCGAAKVSVWLAPEIADFSKKITLYINGKKIPGPFAPNLVPLTLPQLQSEPRQRIEIRFTQERGARRGRGKNCFVHAREQDHFEIWIARAVHLPYEHLVQRQWNHPCAQPRQPRFHDRNPLAQRQARVLERQLQVFQPALHLL